MPFTYDPYYLCDTKSDPTEFCDCLSANKLNPRETDTCPPDESRRNLEYSWGVLTDHPFEEIAYRTPNEYIFNESNPIKTHLKWEAMSLAFDDGANTASETLYTTINTDLPPLRSALNSAESAFRTQEEIAIDLWQTIRQEFFELKNENAMEVVTNPDQCTSLHNNIHSYVL